MKRLYVAGLCLCLSLTLAAQKTLPAGGADEQTPSHSEYFSWINNTWEGATAEQTAINLRFFDWLHRTYGMQLDIYAFDAGTIDGLKRYGNTRSEISKRKFPEGFGSLAKQAQQMGTRLGLWCGPDGFGDTPEEARERIDMMVGFVRDHNFGLFKMDAACGRLRPEKYAYFDSMMTEVRRLSPDFVLLNHRINLGPGTKHSTTFLLGGEETYIDVFMTNDMTAPHHRAKAISRKAPDNLTRLTEDHGVCLSSCLDFWEDDLVLQAFGRELILAPEIYANPWLLRDDEFPTLAYIFNLHRDYRHILPSAKRLPEAQYGPEALSRGDGKTRFLSLRNLSWMPVRYRVTLNDETGLARTKRQVKARLCHPYIQDLGRHAWGTSFEVEVLPFRAALLKLTTEREKDRVLLSGIPYRIINDRVGEEAEVELLGEPGQTYRVSMEKGSRRFRSAEVDGSEMRALISGKSVSLTFPGQPLREKWHRRVAELQPADVPADAASLYYATAFAADNNAMEVRSLQRSGETKVAEVAAARKAFFEQPIFIDREIWDRNLFDGNPATGFFVSQRIKDMRTDSESSFCLDLGAPTRADSLVVCVPRSIDYLSAQPLDGTPVWVSADLATWQRIDCIIGPRMKIDLRRAGAVRYVRFNPCPLRLTEVEGYRDGRPLERSHWRASNLFRTFDRGNCRATKAWKASFRVDEVVPGAYLCVAINGHHGKEGAWAAFKIDGKYVGCPDRAPSFNANPWENICNTGDKNYTYYLPLTPDMAGKTIEAYALKLGKNGSAELQPEVWLTAYPIPFGRKKLVLKSL